MFGETKTAQEWSQDPRCQVGRSSFYRRLQSGWEPLQALATPPHKLSPQPTAATVAQRAASRHLELTIHGETKTVGQWAKDARCEVSVNVLRSRIGRGWAPEDALRAASRSAAKQQRPNAPLYEAFGERKRISEWLQDPRCEVASNALRRRLAAGVPLEQALRSKQTSVPLKAKSSGTMKPLRDNDADPRTTRPDAG